MSLRDWRRLAMVRAGRIEHLRTDPACMIYRAPRPGSLLDRVSRGFSCPVCRRGAA
jgi:hypothetical protein